MNVVNAIKFKWKIFLFKLNFFMLYVNFLIFCDNT